MRKVTSSSFEFKVAFADILNGRYYKKKQCYLSKLKKNQVFQLGLASKMKPLRNLVMHVWLEGRETAFNLLCKHVPSWWSQVEMGKNEQAYNTLWGHLLRPRWDTSLFSSSLSALLFYSFSFSSPLLSLSVSGFSSIQWLSLCLPAYITGYKQSYQTTTYLLVSCFSEHRSETLFLSCGCSLRKN